MTTAVLIFPQQLFDSHPALSRERPVYLVEAPRFFRDEEGGLKFHLQKLALHRASLKAYQERLSGQGYTVNYLEFSADPQMSGLWMRLREDGVTVLHLADPVDFSLEKKLAQGAQTAGITLQITETPAFVCTREEIQAFFQDATHFHQTSFYIHQRKERGILMEGGKPLGGRWTFDVENRRRLPKGFTVPPPPAITENAFHREARAYVATRFADHPGNLAICRYPVTHAEAEVWLKDFLENRLYLFGDYEDAISVRETVISHSVLSPLINIGLLTPRQVLEETLNYARGHPVPLNSLEGFVRQVLGWREYVRAVYLLAGEGQRRA
ncbi:MAG: cryptochrome/photolyase family protein, partial [Desulfobaccales bacterium]